MFPIPFVGGIKYFPLIVGIIAEIQIFVRNHLYDVLK